MPPPAPDRRLRVLYLHDNLRRIGGAETAFYDELSAARARFEVAAHVFDDGAAEAPPEGVTATPYPLAGGSAAHLRDHYVSPRDYGRLRRLIRGFSPDVIHTHKHDKMTLTQLAATHGYPVVHTVHDFGPVCPTGWLVTARTRRACPGGAGPKCVREGCVPAGRFLAAYTLPRWLKRQARLRRIATWITPSQALADTLYHHGYPRARVVPYIQEVAPEPPAFPEGPPRVVFLGHLITSKGPDVLLEAFARIATDIPEARLDLVGDGALRPTLESRTREAGLAARVTFHGWVPRAEATAHMLGAWVVAVPSIWTENSALVAHEGLARARPLVASRIGGLPELCLPGETGMLAEPGDVQEWAARLRELLVDRGLARDLGLAGYRRTAARHSVAAHLDELEEIYREAARQ